MAAEGPHHAGVLIPQARKVNSGNSRSSPSTSRQRGHQSASRPQLTHNRQQSASSQNGRRGRRGGGTRASGDAVTPHGEHANARASGAASSASAHRALDIGPFRNLAETTTIYLSILLRTKLKLFRATYVRLERGTSAAQA